MNIKVNNIPSLNNLYLKNLMFAPLQGTWLYYNEHFQLKFLIMPALFEFMQFQNLKKYMVHQNY